MIIEIYNFLHDRTQLFTWSYITIVMIVHCPFNPTFQVNEKEAFPLPFILLVYRKRWPVTAMDDMSRCMIKTIIKYLNRKTDVAQNVNSLMEKCLFSLCNHYRESLPSWGNSEPSTKLNVPVPLSYHYQCFITLNIN